MSGTPETLPPGDLGALPRDAEDAPVFRAPWEAKAFALVVALHRAGHFSWSEWTAQLGAEIGAAGPEDDGAGYYLLWLSAAEKLVAGKGLCPAVELARRKQALEAAQVGAAGIPARA